MTALVLLSLAAMWLSAALVLGAFVMDASSRTLREEDR